MGPLLRNWLKNLQDCIGFAQWAFAINSDESLTEKQVIRQLLSYLMWKLDKIMKKCWLLPGSFLRFRSLDYAEFNSSVD